MKAIIYSTIVIAALGLQACSSGKKNTNETTTTASQAPDPKASQTGESAQEGKAAAKRGKIAAAGDVTCTSGKDVRTIGAKSADAGCEVIYSKHGETNSVASASKGMDHCVNVVTKIKDNLLNAGFKCE